MIDQVMLKKGVGATGAVAMWMRIVSSALDQVRFLLPPGSNVVEVGYGDGLLTCFLARHFGWKITGFDILPSALEIARENARACGVEGLLDLRLVEGEETWRHKGQYDAVFIKTVLYNARHSEEYARWLNWVVSVLKAGGVFINFENGKANKLTYLYRKARGRYYADLCMYDSDIERLYKERFQDISIRYYGALSQFLSPLPWIYYPIAAIEENLFERNADNSFIAAIVARKSATRKD